jgi:gliding motility-associated-like protein
LSRWLLEPYLVHYLILNQYSRCSSEERLYWYNILSLKKQTMKIIHIFLYLLPFCALAQTTIPPEIEWQRCYGGSGVEGTVLNNSNDIPLDVGILDGNAVVLADGATVFIGNVNGIQDSFNPPFPFYTDGDINPYTFPTPTADAYIGWVVKVSPQGSIIWKRLLTSVLVRCIQKTADGGFIIGGNNNIDGFPTDDMVIKISGTGQEQWRKIIHTDSSSDGHDFITKSIQQTNDGGYICIGMETINNTNTPLPANACTYTPLSYAVPNGVISKLNATGDILWQRCLQWGIGERMDYAMAGQQTADGGYIITGTCQDTTGNPTPQGRQDILVAKLNTLGGIEWKKQFGGILPEYSHGRSIFQTADGGYIIAGTTETNAGDFAGLNPFGKPFNMNPFEGEAPVFLKLNSTGDIVWKKALGGEISERCLWAEPTRDGGFVAVSHIWSTFGTPTYPRTTWVTKHNANGDMEWEKYVGGYTPTDYVGGGPTRYRYNGGQCIRETPDGGYMVYGYAFRNGEDICGNWEYSPPILPPRIDPSQDIWLCKLKTLPTPPEIQGNLALVCTNTTTLTAVQPLSQPTPPASYLWSNNATTQSITNIGAGTYTVTITYENRCTKSTSVTVQAGTINIPPANVSITPAGCNRQGGSAMLNATGGSAPYIYTCASGSINANTITGLNTGTYDVTITDANGCTGTTSITIGTQNSTLNITSTTTPSGCSPTGSATLTVQNGTPPYAYTLTGTTTLTGTSATAVFPPLGGLEGGYVMFITDANGCTGSTTITIPQAPNNLSAIATATQIPCAGGTGSISVSITNGIAPYTVNYTSTNGSNGSTTTTSNTILLPSSGGFGSGDYSVLVRDVSGCTTTATATINAAPLPLTANISVQNATCGLPNGSLTANINGGTAPYTVVWTGNGASNSTTTTANTVLLPSSGGVGGGFPVGGYAVTITDANLCSVIAPTATITSNPPITATITTTPTKCYGEPSGNIAISNVQNAIDPVLYSLDNQALSSTNPILNVLGGAHTVTVEDATGCKLTATANVAEGPRFTVNIGRDTVLNFGDSLLMIANTTSGFPVSPVTYSWTCAPAQDLRVLNRSAVVKLQNTTVCSLVVTDGNGCTANDALAIRIKDANGIFIPNIFTPNGDGANDEFVIFAGSMVENVVLLQVFDRWGALIHQKTDFAPNTPAWDGTVPVGSGAVGSEQRVFPSSVYVYRTEIRLRSGELKTLTGDVTLIR